MGGKRQKPDADLLRRFGFVAGTFKRWCATCKQDFTGAADAFKCEKCSIRQARVVEFECREHFGADAA